MNMFRAKIIIVYLFSIFLVTNYNTVYAACNGVSPFWLCTADFDSINNLINKNIPAGFTPGDTVKVQGNATWNNSLVISKSINLIGVEKPIISKSNYSLNNLINISLSSDVPVRISGFYFDGISNVNGSSYLILISGKKDGSFPYSKVRIDHNAFNMGTRSIYASGWITSLVDYNTFINCNIAVGVTGDNNYSWNRPIQAGTADALFIENNTFIVNTNTLREPNQQIYHQEGGRSVTRFNTFDLSTYTAGYCTVYDSHGNQNYYTGSGDFRGQPLLEVYNNTIKCYKAGDAGNVFMTLRGGSSLIYNNTFQYQTGRAVPINVVEEECWSCPPYGGHFGTCRTTRSGEDQINNTFIWNNTLQYQNETPTAIIDVPVRFSSNTYCTGDKTPFGCCTGYHAGSCEEVLINMNRDYFMHAPASTGGKSIYQTRPGAADMIFSTSGANVYYNGTPGTGYTPYPYPHHLSLTYLDPPKNLTITSGL